MALTGGPLVRGGAPAGTQVVGVVRVGAVALTGGRLVGGVAPAGMQVVGVAQAGAVPIGGPLVGGAAVAGTQAAGVAAGVVPVGTAVGVVMAGGVPVGAGAVPVSAVAGRVATHGVAGAFAAGIRALFALGTLTKIEGAAAGLPLIPFHAVNGYSRCRARFTTRFAQPLDLKSRFIS